MRRDSKKRKESDSRFPQTICWAAQTTVSGFLIFFLVLPTKFSLPELMGRRFFDCEKSLQRDALEESGFPTATAYGNSANGDD